MRMLAELILGGSPWDTIASGYANSGEWVARAGEECDARPCAQTSWNRGKCVRLTPELRGGSPERLLEKIYVGAVPLERVVRLA